MISTDVFDPRAPRLRSSGCLGSTQGVRGLHRRDGIVRRGQGYRLGKKDRSLLWTGSTSAMPEIILHDSAHQQALSVGTAAIRTPKHVSFQAIETSTRSANPALTPYSV